MEERKLGNEQLNQQVEELRKENFNLRNRLK